MAQGDAQLLVAGTARAPVDYEVPGAQEIEPLMVHASYDGSGAAGNYVPCVVFIGPGGVVAGRAPLGSTITAGNNVDATWFPGGVEGGGTAVATHMATIVSQSTATSGSPLAFNIMNIDTFQTDDPSKFVQQTASVWSNPGGNMWLFMRLIPDAVAPLLTDGSVIFLVRWVGHIFISASIPQGVAVVWTDGGGGLEGVGAGDNFRMELGGTDSHNWIMHVEVFATY